MPSTLPRIIMIAAGIGLLPQSGNAVEVLAASELASHCVAYDRDATSTDGEYCARYIQGFIDGAVATDANVMLSVEADLDSSESFTERAMRTRLPSRLDQLKAAEYAGFCLGDPVPLKEVVTKVVGDLRKHIDNPEPDLAARDAVYDSLKRHYPCTHSDS